MARLHRAMGTGILALWLLGGCVPSASSPGPDGDSLFGGPSMGGTRRGGSGGSNGENEGGYIDPDAGQGGDDGGYVAPTHLLFCGETGQIVLRKGQRTRLTWAYPGDYVPPEALQLSLESTPASLPDRGTLTPDGLMAAWYQAPATVPEEATIQVRAALGDNTTPSVCRVMLMQDDDLGIIDDGTTRGAVGNVYVLPVNTPQLPNFALMTPVSNILVPNFDVPTRAFSTGFPGVADLFEWFGIRFEGRIVVPAPGTYQFRLTSDDGSRFWINGTEVINNDGVHAPRTVDGAATLAEGNHSFRLDYYQGPRYHIALQLLWKEPGAPSFVIIPPDNFLRPAP